MEAETFVHRGYTYTSKVCSLEKVDQPSENGCTKDCMCFQELTSDELCSVPVDRNLCHLSWGTLGTLPQYIFCFTFVQKEFLFCSPRAVFRVNKSMSLDTIRKFKSVVFS